MTDYIHVSDKTGIPVTATVTTERGVGSTELIVDSVQHWPARGIALSGTVVDATSILDDVTVFRYHLDGSIIIIESFAAGYDDIGNSVNQVVMIKPTTEWGNEVADKVISSSILALDNSKNITITIAGNIFTQTDGTKTVTTTISNHGNTIVDTDGSNTLTTNVNNGVIHEVWT